MVPLLPLLFLGIDGSKENTVLRGALDPQMVSVIPNAVITDNFRPASFKPAKPPDHGKAPLPISPCCSLLSLIWGSCYCGDITVIL